MAPTDKLPGLARLSEAKLREQYEKETGQPVPADMTTIDAVKAALYAHRGQAEADDLAGSDETRPDDAEPGIMTIADGAELPTGDTAVITVDALWAFAKVATTEELHELHGVLLGELMYRGEVDTEEEAPAMRAEAPDAVHAVKDGEKRTFSAEAWKLLGEDKAGWTEEVTKPKDLQ